MPSLLALFTQCKNKSRSISFEDKFQLELKDSIVFKDINHKVLIVTDYSIKKGKYLALDFLLNNIIEFDTNGNVSHVFPYRDDDNIRLVQPILSMGFHDDNSWFIVTRDAVNIFEPGNRQLKSIKSKYLLHGCNEKIAGTLVPAILDTFLYLSSELTAETHDKIVSESELNAIILEASIPRRKASINKKLVCYSFKNKTFTPIITYPTSSIYRDPDNLIPSNFIYTAWNNEKLYVLYRSEPVIWIYNKNKDDFPEFKLIDSIPFMPDYLTTPVGLPYGVLSKSDEVTRAKMNNISIRGFKIQNDTILILYARGIPINQTKYISGDELGAYQSKNYKEYICILIGNKKVGSDIPLPDNMISVAHINSFDDLLLAPDSRMIEKPYDMFFRYRLINKKNTNKAHN